MMTTFSTAWRVRMAAILTGLLALIAVFILPLTAGAVVTVESPSVGISNFFFSPDAFAVTVRNGHPPHTKTQYGSKINFTLSGEGHVILRITKGNVRKRIGNINYPGKAGSNVDSFTGWVEGKKLTPGRYEARAIAAPNGVARPEKAFFQRAQFTIRAPKE